MNLSPVLMLSTQKENDTRRFFAILEKAKPNREKTSKFGFNGTDEHTHSPVYIAKIGAEEATKTESCIPDKNLFSVLLVHITGVIPPKILHSQFFPAQSAKFCLN